MHYLTIHLKLISGQSYKQFTLKMYVSSHNMGYFQVRYDSRVVIYDRRAFIRLTTELWSLYCTVDSQKSTTDLTINIGKTKKSQMWTFTKFRSDKSNRNICLNFWLHSVFINTEKQSRWARNSVTRWLDYFSIFGHLQQLKLAQ